MTRQVIPFKCPPTLSIPISSPPKNTSTENVKKIEEPQIGASMQEGTSKRDRTGLSRVGRFLKDKKTRLQILILDYTTGSR